jgi:hypothetical protein
VVDLRNSSGRTAAVLPLSFLGVFAGLGLMGVLSVSIYSGASCTPEVSRAAFLAAAICCACRKESLFTICLFI